MTLNLMGTGINSGITNLSMPSTLMTGYMPTNFNVGFGGSRLPTLSGSLGMPMTGMIGSTLGGINSNPFINGSMSYQPAPIVLPPRPAPKPADPTNGGKGYDPISAGIGGLAKGVHGIAEEIINFVGLGPIFGPLVDDPIIHPLLWDPISYLTGVDVSEHPSNVKNVSDPLGVRGGA